MAQSTYSHSNKDTDSTRSSANLAPPTPHIRSRELVRDPLSFFLTLARQYGDIVCYRSIGEPAYLINHPDLAKHILQDNNRNYTKDTYSNHLFRTVVSDGLLTSEGETWLKQRRLMQPAFHQKRLAEFDELIASATQSMLDRWQGYCERQEPVYISQEMSALTLTITIRILFGVDIGDEINRVGQAVDMGSALLEKPTNPRFKESVGIISEVVSQIIAERRQSTAEANDLLFTLLNTRDVETGEGMDDRQLHDQVMTLLLAGYETTASALTWTWYLLARHPRAVQKLRAEAERVLQGRTPTYADTENLVYTLCVFKEGLRLYPSAWVLGRKAIENDVLNGYTIPAGAVLAISPYTIHRHPDFWENPEDFEPERFLPENAVGRHHFAFIPFGGGPRQCIGNNLALLEAQLIIPMVLQQFDVLLTDQQPMKPEAHFVLRPDMNLRLALQPVQ